MSDDLVKRLTYAHEEAKAELRSQVACVLLGNPVTVGQVLDRIEELEAERDAALALYRESKETEA